MGCRKRKGHVFARPAAGIIARVYRDDRVAVHDDREVRRSGKPRVRIGDGDLLLHIKKRRVKGAVIHRVVRDLLRSGIAVIRRDGEPLQVKLIFAFVIGIARVFKRDVRQLFRFEHNRERPVVIPARARNRHNDVLLGIQNALVDLADRVVGDLHGKIAVRPAGRVVILRDVLRVVAQLHLHAGKVQLGLALDVIRTRRRGDREVFGLELDNGDIVGVLNDLSHVDTGRIPSSFPDGIQGRFAGGKAGDRTVVVHGGKAVLLVSPLDILVCVVRRRDPRAAAVIRRQTPIIFIDTCICWCKVDRIAARKILDNIVTA